MYWIWKQAGDKELRVHVHKSKPIQGSHFCSHFCYRLLEREKHVKTRARIWGKWFICEIWKESGHKWLGKSVQKRGWTDGWIDGWMDGQTKNQSSLKKPKWKEDWHRDTTYIWIWLFLALLGMSITDTLAPNRDVFDRVEILKQNKHISDIKVHLNLTLHIPFARVCSNVSDFQQ